MRLAADRILGLALMGLAAFVAVQASRFQVIFSYEPVGPKAFPMLLAALLALLSLVLVLRPGANGHWPDLSVALRLLLVLVVLLVYALVFEGLGFVCSTCLAVLVLARLFGAGWIASLLTGVVMALASYWLFAWGMDISLPRGHWLPVFL